MPRQYPLYVTDYLRQIRNILGLNDHLWESKYSPRDAHGKRISRNVCAKTREECEEKQVAMIEEVKREIAEQKQKNQHQSQSEMVMQ